MISVELTQEQANTILMFIKMGMHSVAPAEQNYIAIMRACVDVCGQIEAGQPVVAKEPTEE